MEEIIKDAKKRMDQAVKKMSGELAKVRTGRASLTIFDNVKVDYYGTPTPVNQMAGLANPEPNLITIQPYDASQMGEIEKAILAANLGLTPSNDGNVIRISVPPLTEERRKEYVKQAKAIGENCKNVIRGIRRDANESLKTLEKDKEISQDQMHTGMEDVQKVTDNHVADIDKKVKSKEDEILTI